MGLLIRRRARGDETVVVTGAAGGVGRAIAQRFARDGARVALIARGAGALAQVAAEVEALGGRALVLACDVADFEQLSAAARRAERELGPIDVWVNNAMATVFARLVDVSAEEFRRATEVTYLGAVHGTMAALEAMRPRNRGTIVQVGSALSYRAIPLQSAYCGAKFALRGFTDSVRTELLADGSAVWITMVQLPGVNTPQFAWCRSKLERHPMPVPPIYQPELCARAVHHAAHHRRRELWVGYSTVQAILGNRLAPRLADRYLAATGIQAQQMQDVVVHGGRPGNLFEPLDELAATHGRFDDLAIERSPQLWCNTHRGWVACAGACLAGGAVAAAARGRRR